MGLLLAIQVIQKRDTDAIHTVVKAVQSFYNTLSRKHSVDDLFSNGLNVNGSVSDSQRHCTDGNLINASVMRTFSNWQNDHQPRRTF